MRMIYRHPHLGRFVSFNDTYLQVSRHCIAERRNKTKNRKIYEENNHAFINFNIKIFVKYNLLIKRYLNGITQNS